MMPVIPNSYHSSFFLSTITVPSPEAGPQLR
jgi:hypothetical protein